MSVMNFKPKWDIKLRGGSQVLKRYFEIRDTIRDSKRSKWHSNTALAAMYCETKEDFELLSDYERYGLASPTRRAEDLVIVGEFKGPDWYYTKHMVFRKSDGSAVVQIDSFNI